MPSSDPDGSASTPLLPDSDAGLEVDRADLLHLMQVFTTALSKLDPQIDEAITGVRVAPWAGDPVSAEAANGLNTQACGSALSGAGSDSADDCSAFSMLLRYQQNLHSTWSTLQQIAVQYHVVEDDNASTFTTQDTGG